MNDYKNMGDLMGYFGITSSPVFSTFYNTVFAKGENQNLDMRGATWGRLQDVFTYEMLTYEQWKEYMDRYRKELREDHDQCWAEEELTAAVAAGITDGKRPHDFVTREEAAIMAVRSRG